MCVCVMCVCVSVYACCARAFSILVSKRLRSPLTQSVAVCCSECSAVFRICLILLSAVRLCAYLPAQPCVTPASRFVPLCVIVFNLIN